MAKRPPIATAACPCVLVLRIAVDESSVRLMKGIRRYADMAGWTLLRIDYRDILDGLVDLWRPVGLLADAGLSAETLSEVPRLNGIPVVFCDSSPDAVGAGQAPSAYVSSDAEAVAGAAFDELVRQGFGHFAYVPFVADPCRAWSVRRGDVFARRARAHGATFSRFSVPTTTAAQRMRALRTWLTALPRPCGVFAANDVVSECVRSICLAEGIGIPEESIAHIFERFYRVDKSHSREIGGTGLGLAIARSAIVMHRGAIRVYSKENEGTTFSVRIPLNYVM